MKRYILTFASFLIFCSALATEPDTVFNSLFRRDIGGWIAADATYSVALPDGRTLWLFGDTFIGSVTADNKIVSGAKFIRNSAVIQDGESMTTLFQGTRTNPSDFFPTEYPDSIWYWPEHGIVENDTLRLFVSKFGFDPDGTPGWNFTQVGSCIANYTWPGIEYINKVNLDVYDINDVIYGDRLLTDTTYVYIYGRRTDDPNINIAYPHVARAPIGEVMKLNWEYFNGTGWSTDPASTSRMSSYPVSQQYSVTSYLGKYILLTQDIWLSPKIYSYTSFSPWGPWSNKKLLYTTPETEGSTFTYNAYVHPQFNEHNQMLMSYNVNGDFSAIFSNVEIYRPRFMRVPYMNIDYQFWVTGTAMKTGADSRKISIIPNPVTNQATLMIEASGPENIRMKVFDTAGKLVLSPADSFLSPGTNPVVINTGSLPDGYYLLKVIYESGSCTLPLIKTSEYQLY